MSATYDLATNVGIIRNIIRDADITAAFFTDEEIESFLTLYSDNVFLAAAEALESWASDQLMVLKVVKLLDLQVDGAAVAREMRMRAGVLRKTAADLDEASDAGFDIAEMALGPFSWREQIWNKAARESD